MNNMLIDSHCHVNFKEYEGEVDQVIKRALDNNTWLINIGSNFQTSQKCIEIAKNYNKGVYATVGLHPIHLIKDIVETAVFDLPAEASAKAGKKEYSFKTKQENFDYEKYKNLAISSDKVVGIGEVGLDFFRLEDKEHDISQIKKIQQDAFIQAINLSQELKLPLVLHARGQADNPYEVYDLMADILKNQKVNNAVLHCYGGTLDQVKKFLDLGLYIGFTGIVTFKNAKEVQEVAKYVPLEKILIETDAPFLAPEPHRGKRNEPFFVKFVAEKIAGIKNIDVKQVEEQTFDNAKKLFKI